MSKNSDTDAATEGGAKRPSGGGGSTIDDFVQTCLDDATRHGCPHHAHALYQQSPPAQDASGQQPFSKIHADTKALATQVLTDAEQNYSVCGYNERAKELFGRIYLGLDKGVEYDRQATKVNSAIQSLSAAAAFDLALLVVRTTLSVEPGASDAAVFVAVLAQICTRWFDLPDGKHAVPGGARNAFPTAPALCPGDYGVPSACMFYEEGDRRINDASRAIGRILKDSHTQYLGQLAETGEKPKGLLSRAIYDAFPEGDRDLVARTTIGVMMGMLPTTYFNLVFVLEAWRANGGKIFAELQAKLRAHDQGAGYDRAYAVLARPMMRAMQGRPMPPEVWRTAKNDHKLGDKDIKAGDHVIVDIAKVTAADLASDKTDVFTIFGGDRSAINHPTHACPGYEAAIAIMLGTINGLMEPAPPATAA